MRIDNLYLVGKIFENISPDSVRSGRTCLAKLGVRSCPVRKLIYRVRSSPNLVLSLDSKLKSILKSTQHNCKVSTHHENVRFLTPALVMVWHRLGQGRVG
jgi:hypothetical protein